MRTERFTLRLLGVAFLFVFAASLLSEELCKLAIGSANNPDALMRVSANSYLLRVSNLMALANSVGIVVLAVLLHARFSKIHGTIALIGLGCWWAEAVTLAVSKLGSLALIPLSQVYVEAGGATDPSYFQTLGVLLRSFDRTGYDIHMLFFCVGGILWYYLFVRSEWIPRPLSTWGLVAISMLLIPVFLALLQLDASIAAVLGLPYAPYELVLGVWLVAQAPGQH